MSYYYEDPGYTKYGNYGDDGYDEYESYLNYVEPDHQEPKPTPSESNHHNYDYVTDPTEYNHHANCEYNADDANRAVNEADQPQWSEYEGDKVQGLDWEGEYEGIEVHEHGGIGSEAI